MKTAFAFAFLLSLTIAFADPELLLFKQWMVQHEKEYAPEEVNARFNIFKDNLKIIEELNKQYPKTTFGANKYADMTTEEFKKKYLSSVDMKSAFDPSWPMARRYTDEECCALPDSWDWRTKGAVTPVKNQEACGSCWAFSATGNMEGQWFLSGNDLIGLSEQNLVDCDHHCMQYEGEDSCDAGCEGGLMPNAFMYVMGNKGIDTESSYPYLGVDDTCQFTTKSVGATIKNWTMIPGNETQMAVYMQQNGPISIAVDAEMWQFYIAGVFYDPWCGETLDHGVLIVGYGNEIDWIGNSVEFWIVKNSWGADWGEEGYIRLEKGSDQCGDNLFPCSSIA